MTLTTKAFDRSISSLSLNYEKQNKNQLVLYFHLKQNSQLGNNLNQINFCQVALVGILILIIVKAFAKS